MLSLFLLIMRPSLLPSRGIILCFRLSLCSCCPACRLYNSNFGPMHRRFCRNWLWHRQFNRFRCSRFRFGWFERLEGGFYSFSSHIWSHPYLCRNNAPNASKRPTESKKHIIEEIISFTRRSLLSFLLICIASI